MVRVWGWVMVRCKEPHFFSASDAAMQCDAGICRKRQVTQRLLWKTTYAGALGYLWLVDEPPEIRELSARIRISSAKKDRTKSMICRIKLIIFRDDKNWRGAVLKWKGVDLWLRKNGMASNAGHTEDYRGALAWIDILFYNMVAATFSLLPHLTETRSKR
jgi:hypothetical protein